jgi:hypothetical protein
LNSPEFGCLRFCLELTAEGKLKSHGKATVAKASKRVAFVP